MELNTHICTQLMERNQAFAQITLDDDYIVRDNKPDVLRVIYTKGDILLEDVKLGNQVVWITGKLRFDTLYQSDDENRRLDSVSGEIPFQEKLVMDDITEADLQNAGEEMLVDVTIEDLSVGIINSRKLVIRAVLDIASKRVEEVDVAISCAVNPELGYEQKTVEKSMLCLVANKKDLIRVQKELPLPNSRTNIGNILFYQVDLRNEELVLQAEQAHLQADAQVWVLYRSESTGEYECYETMVPISGEIDVPRIQGDEVFWAKVRPQEVLVEPRSDYDGEARMIGMELAVEVNLQVYHEDRCEMLMDAYSLEKELLLDKKPLVMNQLIMKNQSKIRLMEQIQLEANQEKILQICGCSGKITIDKVQKRENGLWVEGFLTVHILYNTKEDAMPYAHNSNQVPFEQFVEMEGFTEQSAYWLDEKIEQLQVNLLDNTEYEIKAVIQIGVLGLQRETIENVEDVYEEPMDVEALQKQAGMIGCIRREGEDLWDIAKRYHATEDNILEIGDKVLVIKQVK